MQNGDYIVFLDSDDCLYSEQVLQKISDVIGDSNIDIVYMGFEAYGEYVSGTFLPTEENSILMNRINGWNYANVWDICWKKDFLVKNNMKFIEDRYYEDFLFYIQGIFRAKSYKIAQFPTHLYFSGRLESMTTNITYKKMQDFYYNISKLFEFFEEVTDEYKEELIEFAKQHNDYANRLLDLIK